jgi:protein-L-isoaspartate(D-aspartate) O-methyltransferase
MMPDTIEDARALYAKSIAQRAGVSDPRVIDAFTSVPREDFVGPGPWKIFAGEYRPTPSDDARLLYQDVLVALAEDRRINNGQPSLHAKLIGAVAVKPGEHIVHVGAGTGYYSAILAELAGRGGDVDAYEIEPDLAAKAAANLEPWPQARVHAHSATEGQLPQADVIYVSAGATHPLPAWLDALNDGGRLIFPLTASNGMGFMLLVTRHGDAYAARPVCPAAFIMCAGGVDERASKALLDAMQSGGAMAVRSLRRDGAIDADTWLAGNGWQLSKRAA